LLLTNEKNYICPFNMYKWVENQWKLWLLSFFSSYDAKHNDAIIYLCACAIEININSILFVVPPFFSLIIILNNKEQWGWKHPWWNILCLMCFFWVRSLVR
jgi:hypothetical protein